MTNAGAVGGFSLRMSPWMMSVFGEELVCVCVYYYCNDELLLCRMRELSREEELFSVPNAKPYRSTCATYYANVCMKSDLHIVFILVSNSCRDSTRTY